MIMDIEKLLVRYNGIGKPLSGDEREILLFALYNESEERGGIAANAKRECDRIWRKQQIVGSTAAPPQEPPRSKGTGGAMTPRKLRLLAECLERNFMTDEDRKGWVSDLRGHAKSVERAVMMDASQDPPRSLLRPVNEPLPDGCHCQPGRCMAPVVMGRQMPCLDPQKAAAEPPLSDEGISISPKLPRQVECWNCGEDTRADSGHCQHCEVIIDDADCECAPEGASPSDVQGEPAK